ncbi:MAG: hypothetical protein ACRCTY_08550, partial [Candidatus Adiutrix sp.]
MLISPPHPAFNTPLSALKGVGPKTLASLERAGFFTTGDLLEFCPRKYQDRRQVISLAVVEPGQEALVEVEIVKAHLKMFPSKRQRYIECQAHSDEQTIMLTWYNPPNYLFKLLNPGRNLRLFGRIEDDDGHLIMVHPDLDFLPETNSHLSDRDSENQPSVRAVYNPIGDISPNKIKKLMAQALDLLNQCPPIFPDQWLKKNKLDDYTTTLKTIHAPPCDFEGPVPHPTQTRAFSRLIFFELVFWRFLILKAKENALSVLKSRPKITQGQKALEGFLHNLPFAPSCEQVRVIGEIISDLSSSRPMSRLLQGEVGGGKTLVAGAALF